MKPKKNYWETTFTRYLNSNGIHPSYVGMVGDIANPRYDTIRIGIGCDCGCGKEWASSLKKATRWVIGDFVKNTFDQDGNKVFGKVECDRMRKCETYDGAIKYITEFRIEIVKGEW